MSFEFNKGDTVRVDFETVVYDKTSGEPSLVWVNSPRAKEEPILVPVAALTLVKAAPAAARDLVGTVRGMGENRQPWFKRNGNEWVCATHDETTTDREMNEYPVIGSVPGTPAAEAQEPISVSLRMPGETEPPAKRERLVFRADHEAGIVEEPPEWVDTVEDKHGDCLRRKDDGWIGYGGDGYPVMVKPWANHVLPKYAPYSEVRS